MRALSPWLAGAHRFPVTSHNKERVLWCPVLFCGQQASRIRVPLFWPRAKSFQSCPTLETLWTIYSLPGSSLHGLLFFFPLAKRVIYLFIFSFIFISWRLITLQYCSGFCHTLTWISHGFTCVSLPDPPSCFLSIGSFWVFPVHQARAFVSCTWASSGKNTGVVATPFSRGSSPTKDPNLVKCLLPWRQVLYL